MDLNSKAMSDTLSDLPMESPLGPKLSKTRIKGK